MNYTLAAVERPVGDGADEAMTSFGCLLITAFTTFKSGVTTRNFIIRFITLSLSSLHLSLDCEFSI